MEHDTRSEITEQVCAFCQRQHKAKPAKKGGLKLPLGWKRERETGKVVCRDCWKKRYILRALTFPVASPVSGTWKELDAALKVMWVQTTAASNWMMTQCFVRDVRRGLLDKMPPMPPMYFYPEVRVLFPDLPPQAVVSLEQAVQRKYRAKRYEVVWTCSATLPSMRYPQPFPQHNQSWSFDFDEANRPCITCRIGAGTWTLRLKGGPQYRRQTVGLRTMAERGELAIYKTNDGTILCKLVGWLKRDAPKISTGTLYVRTGKDHLLSALDAREERIWIENCDHLPRIIAEHRRRLQRLSEDQKAEQRPVPSFAQFRADSAVRYRHRIDSVIKEVAAHLSRFAGRRKIALVVYDDRERWLNPFPYFQLEARIKTTLDEQGITFQKVNASGPAMVKSPDPLVEE